MNDKLLKEFLEFLVWSGSKENHRKMLPTLAKNDWYGLKYGNEDLQIFPIINYNDLSTEDILKRFKEWKRIKN